MSVKIDIISGFLGAGKTTLIKKLIEERCLPGKIVIIENEFGSVGIDGKLLKDTGASVREINSGCICCTLAGDFNTALKDVIKRYQPDRIIIEPSGVAKLSDIISSCRSALLKVDWQFGICVAVADVMKYAIYEKNFSDFFLNQIQNAKTVIFSRTKEAPETALEYAVKSINKYNPEANIITTPWEQLSAEKMCSVLENKNARLIEQQHLHDDCCCGNHHDHDGCHDHHHEDKTFEVWSVETPKSFQIHKIQQVLQAIDQYGMILRAKGIVPVEENRWIQFDYVPGEVSLKETSSDYTGRLCVIGQHLDQDKLASLFGV